MDAPYIILILNFVEIPWEIQANIFWVPYFGSVYSFWTKID